MELEIARFSGEVAALSAAFLWAVSSVVYTLLGQRIPPLQLNFLKGIIAIVFILLTLLATGNLQPQTQLREAGLLLFSGVLGIGVGDTAYFAALNRLGARRTLLLETLAPPLTALLALIFLGENLTPLAWGGIIITVCGVAWVITERTHESVITLKEAKMGMFWALLAAISQASGAVLSRTALVNSEITPLWSSLLRLSAGTLIVLLLLALRPQTKPLELTWSSRLLGVIALASFGSTFLGIWLQQVALKFSPAGIAQTLLATSPLFVLPMAVSRGEKVSLRGVMGVLVAIAGIGLLFAG